MGVGITLQLCLATLLLTGATAWWDYGHMLVAAIAREQLGEYDALVLEDILHLWDDDYPGFGHLITAATWADHIKCGKKSAYCSALPAFDNMLMFNDWHYDTIPFNPKKVDLPPAAKIKEPHAAAHCILGHIQRSFMEQQGYFMSNCRLFTPKPNLNTTSLFGSVVSWNLQLRYFLHIYGDLNQPCHSCTTYTLRYPDGDYGGNSVKLMGVEQGNLHAFWDSAAGLYTKSFPTVTIADTVKEARRLIAEFPPRSFIEVISGLDYYALAKEGNQKCQNFVQSELFPAEGQPANKWANWSDAGNGTVYSPSPAYIEKSKRVAERQIVLGGYRLASELKTFVRYAKRFQERRGALRKPTTDSDSLAGHATYSVLGALAALMLPLVTA